MGQDLRELLRVEKEKEKKARQGKESREEKEIMEGGEMTIPRNFCTLHYFYVHCVKFMPMILCK